LPSPSRQQVYLSHVVCLPLFGYLLALFLCVTYSPHPSPPTHHLLNTPHLFLLHPVAVLGTTLTLTYHVPIWCREINIAINRAARGVFAEWNGMTSVSCPVCATTWSGLSSTTHQGGCCGTDQISRSLLLLPPVLTLLRDAFKRATYSRADWLACSASFCGAILKSIGESNRLAISNPDTDTLHSSPLDIIHQCDDCSSRGNDGRGSRHLASASEEKAFIRCQTPCTHRHV
jgi:hypothetical protein